MVRKIMFVIRLDDLLDCCWNARRTILYKIGRRRLMNFMLLPFKPVVRIMVTVVVKRRRLIMGLVRLVLLIIVFLRLKNPGRRRISALPLLLCWEIGRRKLLKVRRQNKLPVLLERRT